MKIRKPFKKLGFVKLQNGLVELVGFSNTRNSKKIYFLIGGGESKLTKWDEIIETFDIVPESYNTELRNLTARFYKVYHPPTAEIKESGGWISPQGKFYPVKYYQHSIVAGKLSLIYHESTEGDLCLENHGWLHLSDTGYATLYGDRKKVTSDQIDTMLDIHAVSNDQMFKTRLMNDINRFAEKYL